MQASGTARDYGWLSLAVVMGALAVVNVLACVVSVLRGDLPGLVRVAFWAAFGYWMAVGAWRRTRWGLVLADAPLALDATHTRRLVVVAATCCIALTFALALQVVVGRA